MSKSDLKERARKLRKKGLSLNEIIKKLNISKSTASLWCRDIKLSNEQITSLGKRAKLKNYAGAIKGAWVNHMKSQAIINYEREKAVDFIDKISEREICLIGTALYWAEGNKTGRTFGIVNSDYKIILLCMRWLKIQFEIKTKDYLPRLFINQEHKVRESYIKKYWSNLTKIPVSQFRNTIFVNSKHKKIFPRPYAYVGVMHLRIKKSSRILYRALGQIEVLKKQIEI